MKNTIKSLISKGLKVTVVAAVLAIALSEQRAAAQPPPVRPTHVRRVILYDYTVTGGHGISRTALRTSMQFLASKYGFQLDMVNTPATLTAAYLVGAQILMTSNGDGDVFNTAAIKQATQDFVEVQGHSIFMIHASGAFIPCPTSGQEILTDPGCLFLARVAVRQYYNHVAVWTPETIYVDSTLQGAVPMNANAGTPAATINHGIKNVETRNIFNGLARNWTTRLQDEFYNFRASSRLQQDMTYNTVSEKRVNVLWAANEAATSFGTLNMGDHPIAWTRKMGNGPVAYNSTGHTDGVTTQPVYIQQDSAMQRFNWQVMRYLARDFVGCMDATNANYNPEASIGPTSFANNATATYLTPVDTLLDANIKCAPSTPVKFTVQKGKSGFGISARSSIEVSLNETGKQTISVVDVSGKQLYSKSVVGPSQFNVPGLRNGVYFVNVTSATHTETKKINLFN